MFLIFLRSLVFNVLFYTVLVCLAIVALPTFALPPRAMLTVAQWWAKATLFLMRAVCNIKVEFRGLEKIPRGPLVVVAKHQSFWETFVLPGFFDRPIFILKRQLMQIPVFGQFLVKTGMIAIDRNAGVKALLDMTRRAREAVRSGGQLVIFPEGTRRARARHRTTRAASRRSIRPAARRACRSRSIPACSGRAAPSCAIPARWWWNSSIRCRRACPRTSISRVQTVIEDATGRLVEAGRKEQEQLIGSAPSYAPLES